MANTLFCFIKCEFVLLQNNNCKYCVIDAINIFFPSKCSHYVHILELA